MSKSTGWLDAISLIFSVIMIGIFAAWTVQSGFVPNLLAVDQSLTWQFIRSTGITAYILLTLSTVWGLALSSKIVKDWSPGTLSMLLHTSVSWLAIGFAALHAILLLFDDYVPYHLLEIMVPFTGPYRPVAVGIGILAWWIMLVVAFSFAIKKRLGHRRWKALHYASYASFFMVTGHVLLAGTDASKFGFRILIGLAVFAVVILTGYRIGAGKPTKRPAAQAR